MKNIEKISSVFILSLLLLILLTVSSSAEALYPRVIDGADLLTDGEVLSLTEKLDSLSQKYSQDIVVVTTYSLDGRSPAKYAEDFFKEGEYGYGDNHSGVMLLVSMEFRDYYILTAGDAVDIFSDSDLDALEDAFLEYLSEGSYYDAFDAFAEECGYIIKYDGRLTPIWIFISLFVGAVVSGLAIQSMISKHKGVKPQRTANSYMRRDTFRLDRSRDIYLYSHVTRVLKPQNDSSRRSSGGGSYGGRGGKF